LSVPSSRDAAASARTAPSSAVPFPYLTMTAATASPEATATVAPSPTTSQAYAACSAIIEDIPFIRTKTGPTTIAAAYPVTGQQMTSYFTTTLNNGPMSNGSDWWNSATKVVDMCVFDGDFEATTPGPPGHDTNATRVLVVIDGSDAMSWAFCFASMTSCGISTADPATLVKSSPIR
jgi:hypothetical protein